MRLIEGPRDMPEALRRILARAGEDSTMRVEPADVALVWGTKEMASLAAEAAVDIPLSQEMVTRLYHESAIVSKRAATLVLFPRGALPTDNGYAMRGFFTRSVPLSGSGGDVQAFLLSAVWESLNADGAGKLFAFMDLAAVLNDADIPQWEVLVPPDENGHYSRMSASRLRAKLLVEEDVPPYPWIDWDKMGAFVMACMHLMNEPAVVAVDTVRAGRKDAVRTASGEWELPKIRRLTLRPMRYVRTAPGERDAKGREYRCRWVVRGHWRQQWYAATQEHRPVYIASYLKGPEGAPLNTAERVFVWNR